MRTNRKLLSFLNWQLHCLGSVQYCCFDGGRFQSNSARLYVSFLFIFVFALYWLIRVWFSFLLSFFINWYAFNFYLVLRLSPLGKRLWGIWNISVRLYLFLFAFSIICIRCLVCIFHYLYWNLWFSWVVL